MSWPRARARAARALALLGADIDPDARIQSLNRTEKSLVAISRALAADATLLVLDEPTASLPAERRRAALRLPAPAAGAGRRR